MAKRNVVPDWNRIYSLEMELWGCTFAHLGAPSPECHPEYHPDVWSVHVLSWLAADDDLRKL